MATTINKHVDFPVWVEKVGAGAQDIAEFVVGITYTETGNDIEVQGLDSTQVEIENSVVRRSFDIEIEPWTATDPDEAPHELFAQGREFFIGWSPRGIARAFTKVTRTGAATPGTFGPTPTLTYSFAAAKGNVYTEGTEIQEEDGSAFTAASTDIKAA